jgi:hypothetical protein
MPGSKTDTLQGPFEGSRCLFAPGEYLWRPGTVRRVNEDGTLKIEPEIPETPAIPYWYGITAAEISLNDSSRWEAIFSRISPDARSLGLPDFEKAMLSFGFNITSDQSRQFWSECCQKLFPVPAVEAEQAIIDREMSYQVFLNLGISAKYAAGTLELESPSLYFKFYWNQTRMGGREPAEIHRRVTLEDALAALGLSTAGVNESAKLFLEKFERKQDTRLPATLVELLCRNGVAEAITDCHPNNPNLIEFDDEWNLRRGMREQQLSGDYALSLMVPHQGSHTWAAVFDDKEDDARVYGRYDTENGEEWMLTAPGIGMFFWDLAQTGLTWHQDTLFNGGKPVKRSDIGLVLDS